MHRFLHVANGASTTMTIEAAGIPGRLSIWADPLHDGPVPAGLSDEELLAVREQHHGLGGDEVNDLRRWRAAIGDRDSYDELVLWYEHDLFCQLNLIQLLTWIRPRVPVPVTLICIGSFPGRPTFKGLGELSAAELAPLLDTRRIVTGPEYDLAEHAWRAFREPSPEPLDEVRRSNTSALPFLGRALERFLQEYPWTRDGLSRSERRLMQLAEPAPLTLRAAFPRMHDGEDAHYVSDTSLVDLVETLSTTHPPLMAVDADVADPERVLRSGTVHLTTAGREVLSGRRDRVACGLDRWLGGVHLQTGAAPWRWDQDRNRVVRR
jgi:hypothetical protein